MKKILLILLRVAFLAVVITTLANIFDWPPPVTCVVCFFTGVASELLLEGFG